MNHLNKLLTDIGFTRINLALCLKASILKNDLSLYFDCKPIKTIYINTAVRKKVTYPRDEENEEPTIRPSNSPKTKPMPATKPKRPLTPKKEEGLSRHR